MSTIPSNLEREAIERILPTGREFNIDSWRSNEIIEFFKKAVSPVIRLVPIDEEDDDDFDEEEDKLKKRGVSEEFFFEKLQEKFLDKVSNNSSLLLKQYEDIKPEILYFDSTIKLCINIEIDEPYEGSKGLPIHNSLAKEALKDIHYSSCRWCVIRFAEQQIHNQTYECIMIIEKVINSIKNGKQLEYYNLVSNVKNWTKDESIMMAYQRFRESYLPQNLVNQLKTEVLKDPYKIILRQSNFDNDGLPF